MGFKYTSNKENNFNQLNGFNTNPIKKDKKFFCSMGDTFMLKNEYRKAVKEYLLSLMLDKNNVPAQKGASKAYKNLKEYDKAIKHLKSARNVYSFDSEIYYELGLNYLLNNDNISAKKNFIRTIKLEPDNKNAQLKLALTHELAGEAEMAALVYDTIIEKYPHFIPAYASLANILIEEKYYVEAINLYKKILKINSEYYRAHLGLGICFDKIEKYTYAIRHYKKYISAKPNSQTAKSLAGRIFEIHNKKDKKNYKNLKLMK